jgi:hypothetical protein
MSKEEFIAASITAHPADKGRVLVSSRGTGSSVILPQELFSILRQADRFDTIAGHTKRLLAAGWEDDGSGLISSAYQELIARGLMVPKSPFLTSLLKKGREPEAPPPVTSLVVTTRDRVPQLQRCLGGFIENNQKHGRNVDYLVIDDSRNQNQTVRIEGVLSPFVSTRAKVYYAGMEEKVGFMHELVRAGSAEGLPEDIVAFCLLGDEGFEHTFGANRNALLLATAGELIVMTDDDTVYKTAVLGIIEKNLELTSIDPTVLRFYTDRRESLATVRAADVDIVSCHEKLLGRSITGCESSLGPDCTFIMDRLGPDSTHLLGRMPTVVSATMSGVWGDSGLGSPNAVLELLGESRNLTMRSKAEYVRATNCREVFRGVSRYTISDGALFMATNAGLDNRTLLPPFIPAGRNEDGIFALTLRACAEHALIGHLPFAIHHAPDEARQFPPGAFLDTAPRIADIIAALMRSFIPSPGHRSMAENLSAMGKLFVDLGTLETDDFEEQIKSIWLATASRYIGFLEYLLDLHHGQPDFWAKDVLTLIENFKDFIVHRSPAVPRELAGIQSTEQAKESCKRLVRKFGELLRWWPVIYGAAKQLREAGTPLVRPV